MKYGQNNSTQAHRDNSVIVYKKCLKCGKKYPIWTPQNTCSICNSFLYVAQLLR